ncbi:hypothetical protein PanWU01x14_229820 [Parasponia andersonii]|uniref:Uncharacterized protein n=1 Tax=Parasponia andersonii TaxID=3476 RepID=A0A2P5BL02_PARAD|nr:hypothetical protein PanWU01x14_229820 [Parasponia andersonii]
MASLLDRYTNAFLLSTYGFNDYCLKPNPRSTINVIDSALNPNSRLAVTTSSSFKGVNLQDTTTGSSFKEVNVHGAHRIVLNGNVLDFSAREITGGGLAAGVAQKELVSSNIVAMHKVVNTTLARNDKSALISQMVGCLDPMVVGQV